VSLTAGTHLGPYEIVAPIGAGGMGEVYRAHDTKLGRDVAIKVLPESFAHGTQSRSAFTTFRIVPGSRAIRKLKHGALRLRRPQQDAPA
jgi:serine/threonine protein kinase